MRLVRVWLLLLLLAPVGSPVAVAADPDTLTIETADAHVGTFTIELARTDTEREIGLMNRASMPADHGMLFDFGADQPVNMWMKDTLIPLDMLFIDRAGRIAGIAERAVPMSEAIIASPGKVRAVLEVNGGTAERLHIAVGDRVRYAIFAP